MPNRIPCDLHPFREIGLDGSASLGVYFPIRRSVRTHANADTMPSVEDVAEPDDIELDLVDFPRLKKLLLLKPIAEAEAAHHVR